MMRIMGLAGVLAAPGVAMAHPEHTSGEALGLVHFVSDPFHLGMTLAAVLAFFVLRRLVVRRRAPSCLHQQ